MAGWLAGVGVASRNINNNIVNTIVNINIINANKNKAEFKNRCSLNYNHTATALLALPFFVFERTTA